MHLFSEMAMFFKTIKVVLKMSFFKHGSYKCKSITRMYYFSSMRVGVV